MPGSIIGTIRNHFGHKHSVAKVKGTRNTLMLIGPKFTKRDHEESWFSGFLVTDVKQIRPGVYRMILKYDVDGSQKPFKIMSKGYPKAKYKKTPVRKKTKQKPIKPYTGKLTWF